MIRAESKDVKYDPFEYDSELETKQICKDDKPSDNIKKRKKRANDPDSNNDENEKMKKHKSKQKKDNSNKKTTKKHQESDCELSYDNELKEEKKRRIKKDSGYKYNDVKNEKAKPENKYDKNIKEDTKKCKANNKERCNEHSQKDRMGNNSSKKDKKNESIYLGQKFPDTNSDDELKSTSVTNSQSANKKLNEQLYHLKVESNDTEKEFIKVIEPLLLNLMNSANLFINAFCDLYKNRSSNVKVLENSLTTLKTELEKLYNEKYNLDENLITLSKNLVGTCNNFFSRLFGASKKPLISSEKKNNESETKHVYMPSTKVLKCHLCNKPKKDSETKKLSCGNYVCDKCINKY